MVRIRYPPDNVPDMDMTYSDPYLYMGMTNKIVAVPVFGHGYDK